MTKTLTTDLKNHIAGPVTTLATLWQITRLDGLQLYFTDHDADLVFSGNTYISSSGYNRTNIVNNSTLAVDNLDIVGLFDDSSISERDLRAGMYNYSRIDIAVVNWMDLSQGTLKLRTGWLGEVVSTPQGWFQAELRGLSQALAQVIGEVYQPACRASLGDSRCMIPIKPPLRQDATFYAQGSYIRVATDGSVITTWNGEPTQDAYENRIYQCTSSGYTGSTAPTYDTTVGATTTEVGLKAHVWMLFEADSVGEITDGETVTINGRVYTFQTTLTNVDGHIQIGVNNQATRDNFVAAVTLGAGVGTAYAAAMTANVDVTATALTPGVYRTAGHNEYPVFIEDLAYGEAGNTITLASSNTTKIAWVDIADNTFAEQTTLFDGQAGAVFKAFQAWTRNAVVASVTNNRIFSITVDESRSVDRWFADGAVTFQTGNNAGFTTEVKNWTVAGSQVTLFLSAPFTIQVGDIISIYRGCDKSIGVCHSIFDNVINMQAEPFVPGTDILTQYPNA